MEKAHARLGREANKAADDMRTRRMEALKVQEEELLLLQSMRHLAWTMQSDSMQCTCSAPTWSNDPTCSL